jgi:hypothetical protein
MTLSSTLWRIMRVAVLVLGIAVISKAGPIDKVQACSACGSYKGHAVCANGTGKLASCTVDDTGCVPGPACQKLGC